MKLSIIIPVYNVAQFLEKCVQSALQQDLQQDEFEVLLIDDGSTDNCSETVSYTHLTLPTKRIV